MAILQCFATCVWRRGRHRSAWWLPADDADPAYFERVFDAGRETVAIPRKIANPNPFFVLFTMATMYGVFGPLPGSVPGTVLALCACGK